MSSVGIFDLPAIQQSCWQTCESDPGAFPADLAEVPPYRHDDTREQFYGAATFFGCVDICEGGYKTKRIAFIAPVAAVATAALILVASCWFCKCCALYKLRKRREKHRMLTTGTSLDLPPATAVTNEGYEGDEDTDPAGGGGLAVVSVQDSTPPPSYRSAVGRSGRDPGDGPDARRRQGGRDRRSSSREDAGAGRGRGGVSTVSGRVDRGGAGGSKNKNNGKGGLLQQEPIDLGASIRSNVSINSWVTESEEEKQQRRRKSFLATATRLGHRLVDMDRTAEAEAERRRRGGPKSRSRRGGAQGPADNSDKNRDRSRGSRSDSTGRSSNKNSSSSSSKGSNSKGGGRRSGGGASGGSHINNPPMRF